jgi:hypothetical protein
MKETYGRSVETEESTNLYPIYPDIDGKIPAGRLSEDELIQENDIINPDPDSLDRG